ncbi:MAG: phosphotransferase [Acidobacteriota bacterium]|nr:phosphotransferase [Acidobacteriota bacterium]
MSKASDFRRHYPGVFFLEADDTRTMSEYVRGLGWLAASEEIVNAERAGEGNMNYTLRVHTSSRTFILKQARPWVEKYPVIAAPWDRAVVEGKFYQLAGTVPVLAAGMPKLMGLDEKARLLGLEDLGTARDFTYLYAGGRMASGDLEVLLKWLSLLHGAFRDFRDKAAFANREMRALNHQHIFVIPLANVTGSEYKREVTRLGDEYLREGDCLLHGDYFPGSWLQTPTGVRIIDPEFCFFGPPEFDLGVLLAHLIFSGYDVAELARLLKIYGSAVHERLVVQFAGVEIMRRLLGVAQLPLILDAQAKTRLLKQSKEMVLDPR